MVAGGSAAALRRRGLSVSVMVLPPWVWTRSDAVAGLPFWRRAAGTARFGLTGACDSARDRCEVQQAGQPGLLVSYNASPGGWRDVLLCLELGRLQPCSDTIKSHNIK